MSTLAENLQTAVAASPAPGATPRGAGDGFGLDGWLRLAGEVVRFPVRILGLGLEVLARTGQQSRRIVGGGVEDAVSQGYAPAGPVAATELWAVRYDLAPPPLSPSTPGNLLNAVQVQPVTAGAVGAGGAGETAAAIAGTTDRKERHMSCEQDLSGSDLKIIQYSIITVDPYIDDCEDDEDEEREDGWNRRVLFGPSTISTTQDMTEADFTAWVIALNFQQAKAKKIRHCEKQYLRVCYSVQCRLPMPEANYPQRQVEVLQEINRTLGGGKHGHGGGGLPAKTR